MTYVITKTHYGIGAAILVIGAIVLVWYGYNNWGWFSGSITEQSEKDGDACVDSNGNPSTYLNGVCQEIVRPGPGGGNGNGSGNMQTRMSHH